MKKTSQIMTDGELYELRDIGDININQVFADIEALSTAGVPEDEIYAALKEYYLSNGRRK